MPDTLCNFSSFWLSANMVIRASNNCKCTFFWVAKQAKLRELMNPFKTTGCCHRSDPAERTSVDSLPFLIWLLMFLLVQGCLYAPRRSLRQQSSSQRVQARAGNHEGGIYIIVHGRKDKEKKHFWPLNEDCWEGQHLMVCKHKLRAINALLIPTIIPFELVPLMNIRSIDF